MAMTVIVIDDTPLSLADLAHAVPSARSVQRQAKTTLCCPCWDNKKIRI